VPAEWVVARVEEHRAELVEIRRDLHAHPEIGHAERRSTQVVADRLRAAGLEPRMLPGSGLVCDLGPADGPRVMLRADLDALPVPDTCPHPWRSENAGVAHACGHDVHTAVVLGAGLVLAELAADGLLDAGVRLLFQAAEEVQPGGALAAIEAGVMAGVAQVYGVHCEPKLDVGQVGTRIGPITSASDPVTVTVTSAGGHTSRPHLTGDVVFALGQVITQVPAILGRRLDPRAGVNLTWGTVHAGTVHNAIPAAGQVRGSLRCLDSAAWADAAAVLREAVEHVTAPYRVAVEVHHEAGVPPVVNDEQATRLLDASARAVLGPEAVVLTEQSLGGEDFGWLLTRSPGAMARLGTRTPGGHTYDLHQGDLDVEEGAISVGARLLVQVALMSGAAVAARA
jgi:amidohydrolase